MGAKGRERGETAAFFPHRAAVPVKRGGRSGATASPFRRNGITVPAQRGNSAKGRDGISRESVCPDGVGDSPLPPTRQWTMEIVNSLSACFVLV